MRRSDHRDIGINAETYVKPPGRDFIQITQGEIIVMKNRRLFFASAVMSLAPAALFAGSNPKATGTFTFITNIDNKTTATVALSAQQVDSLFNGKGTLVLQDVAGTAFLDVKYVHVIGNVAYIASQVAEGSNYVGQPVGSWYVNMVVDNGEPGVGHDTIKGAAIGTDPANALKALTWVTDPQQAAWQTVDIPITSGNIQVHQ